MRIITVLYILFIFTSCEQENDNSYKELKIIAKDKNIEKLNKLREEALSKGYLIKTEESWVKGKILDNSKEKKIKFRLKGDHVDHLENKKWSFRVKMKNENVFDRLKTFSLHTPKARFMLAEWMYHKVLDEEDILSTRYEFLKLKLNEEYLGIYAIEEHFEKHLLEYKNRREGVIIALDESYLWDDRIRNKERHIEGKEVNFQRKSNIKLFKDKKYLKDSVKRKQFFIAQNMLEQYRYGLINASKVFDIEKLAKYYAITDIFQAYHGIIWHNERWYYNPVTSKLEPIGFDGFSDDIFNWVVRPFLGYGVESEKTFGEPLLDGLFNDQEFKNEYIKWLYYYSQNSYLERVYEKYKEEIKNNEELLKLEFPDYKFDYSYFLKNANNIHSKLEVMDEHSLLCYNDGFITSNHPVEIEIIGFSDKLNRNIVEIDSTIYIKSRSDYKLPSYQKINVSKEYKFIYFKTHATDSIYYSKIKKYESPKIELSSRQLATKITIDDLDRSFRVIDKSIFLAKGSYVFDNDVIIPKGYNVIIKAGSKLNFIKKSKFISYSPIHIYGTKDELVEINSSDSSANGFTMLQNDISEFNNVVFNGFNTLNDNGWELTGALTFYESNVKLRNVVISNSKCEDALNIVRSNFNIDQLKIITSYSDGFDADFCTGEIRNSMFINIGNDGMDFSGSKIFVHNCRVNLAGDKGLSAGEESKITVEELSISNSNIGIASKDLSEVKLKKARIEDCNIGLAAYKKKMEYGPARIKASELKYINVKKESEIEKESTLNLN